MGLEYRFRPTDLSKGEHLDPANVAGAINGKLPVIHDDSPADGGDPITIFESGAILQYLAEKSGRFLPADGRARIEAMQWLFWQMGGIRSEEHTSELQSLMRTSYAVFCLKKKIP